MNFKTQSPKTPAAGPVSPDDLARLRRLALEATKGTWSVRSHPGRDSFVQAPREDPEHAYDIEILGDDDTLYSTREADVHFIAAAQPTLVLALLDELEQLRAVIAQSA